MKNKPTPANCPKKHNQAYLRRIRKALDLSVAAFAGRVGLKKDRLARLEQGETPIRPEERAQIAACLHMTEPELVQFDLLDLLEERRRRNPPADQARPAAEHNCAGCTALQPQVAGLRTDLGLLQARLESVLPPSGIPLARAEFLKTVKPFPV